jgi:cyanophycinase-like exopeptidase
MRILSDTRVRAALQAAWRRGVFIAGSSGGAMLLGARSEVVTPELAEEIGRVWETGAPPDWDPPLTEFIDCLGWVAHGFCAPHFNRVFTWKWLEHGILADNEILIGLDEQTALVSRPDDRWEVRGHGGVTLIHSDLKPARYQAGEIVRL